MFDVWWMSGWKASGGVRAANQARAPSGATPLPFVWSILKFWQREFWRVSEIAARARVLSSMRDAFGASMSCLLHACSSSPFAVPPVREAMYHEISRLRMTLCISTRDRISAKQRIYSDLTQQLTLGCKLQ